MAAVAHDWRTAALAPREAALCGFAEKLTLAPSTMAATDIEELRKHALDDRAIHDATQVIAYFNYINRIADALHVDLEPEMTPVPRAEA
ncbi:MAG: peroxidase [Planctomycetes bacterium]|nr:peroxidase [Planctomycetota bacterium]